MSTGLRVVAVMPALVALLTGCAARQPAEPQARIAAPEQSSRLCSQPARVTADVILHRMADVYGTLKEYSDWGEIVFKGKFEMRSSFWTNFDRSGDLQFIVSMHSAAISLSESVPSLPSVPDLDRSFEV